MRIARVIYREENEGWWAFSPEVPGWNAVGESYDEVRELAAEGIGFFTGATYQLIHMRDREGVMADALTTAAEATIVSVRPLSARTDYYTTVTDDKTAISA